VSCAPQQGVARGRAYNASAANNKSRRTRESANEHPSSGGVKVFISYSRTQHRLAESLSVRLLGENHTTFFDVTSLPAGEGYDAKIRDAINKADLFVFLISPDSIRKESYAQAEMTIAQGRWPNPSGRVLPVMVEPTPLDQVPPYLTAVTVLQPKGNLEAAVLDQVAKIASRRRSRNRWVSLGLGALLIVAAAYFLVPRPHAEVCYLNAELQRRDGGTMPPSMMLDVTYAAKTETFLLSPDALAKINVGPFKKNDERWTVALRNPDGSVAGTEVVQGCGASAQERTIGENFNLILSRPQ
jgi:hypothetical protein